MRVIVAGGTGFIGAALVRTLLERGDSVGVLARNPRDVSSTFGQDVDAVEWHPPQAGPWVEVIGSADAVINLAGAQVASPFRPWTSAYRDVIRGSRVGSTRALVGAMAQAERKPRVFVSQSAIGYYGSQGAAVLTEESPPGKGFLADVVQQWEAAARPAEKLGVRVVWLRTGIVLGEGGGLLSQFLPPFKMFAGGAMGWRDQWVSWIHLDDEVGLIVDALTEDEIRGPVNATAPDPVTMQQFSAELGRALHRPSWVPFYGPLLRVFLGKRSEAVLASQRVLPKTAESRGYEFKHPELREALSSILQ